MEGWHDFYALIGTAAATLVGLLSVAVSVTAGYMTEDMRPGQQVFVSPTMVYFAVVLITSLVADLPRLEPPAFGAFALAAGVFGLAYSALVLRRMWRHGLNYEIELDDKIYYGVGPMLCFALLVAAGTALRSGAAAGSYALAVALVLLVIVCLRNAWDMTVWAVMSSSKK